MWFDLILVVLASGPPPAAHARPLGLKRHSRREDAFKEGRRHSRGINADKKIKSDELRFIIKIQ